MPLSWGMPHWGNQVSSNFPVRRRANRTFVLGALIALVSLTGSLVAADPAEAPAEPSRSGFEESWQVVYIGPTRVGFGRSTSEHKQIDGREVVVSDTEMSLAITRFGQAVKVKTVTQTEETPSGELLTFRFEMLNPPAAPTRKTGRVTEGKLLLESETAGKITRSEVPWNDSIKAPGYQDRQLRESTLKPGEKRTLKSFDPQYGKLNTIELQAADLEEVELLGGEKKKLLKVTLTTSVAPGIVLNEFLNAEGEALLTTVSLMKMATYKVSKEEALKAISGEEADLAVATLVKTTRLERPQQTQKVVYRISTPGDDPAKILSIGPTQVVASLGHEIADVTVKAIVPPAQAPADASPAGPEFLTSNSHIQSDDEQVKKLAKQAVGTVTEPWTASRLMERWVYLNLKKKNFSTLLASAAEVAKDLQGDCTEHAVLLAAMARAQKIPARIAVGLVYVSGATSFGGHMWTEVYINGTWVPLDGTLGLGGIAAEHIKFADSSFADDADVSPLSTFLPLVSVLGKMKIEIRDVQHKP